MWITVGRVAFWVAWPLSWLTLKLSVRSRILIISNHRVLLVQNWLGDGKWCLPGGGLHNGEDPAVGATREVREELGLQLEPSQIKSLGKFSVSKYGLDFKHFIFVGILPQQTAVKAASKQIVGVSWWPLDTLGGLNTDPSVGLAVAAWQRKP